MAFLELTVTPSGDVFNDLYNKFNNNAKQSIDVVTLNGNTLLLTRANGTNLPAIQLPISENRIISGLVASSVGFTLSTTAGVYQVNNTLKTVGAGLFSILPAHATLNRIDVLVGTLLGTLVYTAGTPATNPVPPFVAADECLITTINVPAAATPNLNQGGFYTLPQGTVNGQTLRWDLGAQKWIVADSIKTTGASTLITAQSFYALNVGTSPINSYHNLSPNSNQAGVQLGAGTFHEMMIDASGINLIANGTAGGALNVDAKQGIYINSNLPSNTVDKLYNDGGILYWNGQAICISPCGGGGGLPLGTTNFSTIRYDFGSGLWIENTFNLANDNVYNETCNFLSAAPTIGGANFATAIAYSQGINFSLSSRASAILACQSDNSITHIPANAVDGGNYMLGSNLSVINLNSNYKGLISIENSVSCSISDTGIIALLSYGGKSFIKGSSNCTITVSIDSSSIITSKLSDIENAKFSSIIDSENCNLGTSPNNLTNNSTILASVNSVITNFDAVGHRNVIIGSDSSDLDSGQTCGIYSCFGGHIKSYVGIGAIKCINSFIIGGVDNTLDPNGLSNHQNCFISGGTLNKIFGNTGNASNSAIISSTNSQIVPNGAGNRIVIIGLDGFSADRNATTYVDRFEHRGGKFGGTTELNASILIDESHYAIGYTILAAPQTVTLPAIPVDGQELFIENPDGTCIGLNVITINGNGHTINGAPTQVLNTPYFSVALRYYGAVGKWSMK